MFFVHLCDIVTLVYEIVLFFSEGGETPFPFTGMLRNCS
uniref:Uncharacterized protein n=1 Tax=Arundo donax TaxID=35708 RepID=A0A0A9C912_ARUDO